MLLPRAGPRCPSASSALSVQPLGNWRAWWPLLGTVLMRPCLWEQSRQRRAQVGLGGYTEDVVHHARVCQPCPRAPEKSCRCPIRGPAPSLVCREAVGGLYSMSHGTWPSPGMCPVRRCCCCQEKQRGRGTFFRESLLSHPAFPGCHNRKLLITQMALEHSAEEVTESGALRVGVVRHFPVQLFFHTAILTRVCFLNPNPQLSLGFFVTCLGHSSSECLLSGRGSHLAPSGKDTPSPGSRGRRSAAVCAWRPLGAWHAPGSQVVTVWHASITGLRESPRAVPSPRPHC